MSPSTIPTPSEYRARPVDRLIPAYRSGVEQIDRRVLQLDTKQADTFFLPEASVGRWSCRVLLGHVADAELAYTHRMRRIAAEEHPVLACWDENAFVDAGLYSHQPIAGSVALVHTLRLWTGEWLETLPPSAWERSALHPEFGSLTLHDVLATAVWHIEHHARFLVLKLDRLLGPSA